MGIFFDSFITVGQAVFKVFALILAGFILSRLEIISDKAFDEIGDLIIYFTLPALILSNFLGKADLQTISRWWAYPLGTYLLITISVLLGLSITWFLDWPNRRQFAALISFPNTGYLPLALTAAILAEPFKSEAYILIFLIIMGMSPALWSLGVILVSGKVIRARSLIKRLITSPPLVTVGLSILILCFNWQTYVPNVVLDVTSFAGQITLPLVMIVLGGTLAKIGRTSGGFQLALVPIILIKLILYPAMALVAIYLFKPPEILGYVLLLEAATTPATNLAVIGRHYGNNVTLLNKGLLYTYIAAIITIPTFISLFNILYS